MPSRGWTFPGRNILFFSFLAGHAFPKFGLLVAIAGIFLSLNLIGTFWGVVLIQLVGTLLFMIWIPVAAFQSVDRRMEEAARDVGASPLRVFWSITLPQAGPTIAAAVLLSFVGTFYETEGAWLIGAPQIRTLPVLMISLHQQPAGHPVWRGALGAALGPVVHRAAVRAPRHQLGPLRPRLRRAREDCCMSVLDIKDVTKSFSTHARRSTASTSTVGDGELVCLLGPSGSGKSTLLRMVGGFETPTSGLITIDGEDVTHVPPEKRPTGMVFQSHALWTHMNVFKNLAFGLKLRTAAGGRDQAPGRGRARAGRPRRLRPRGRPTSSRAASSSAWRWRARWCWSRRSCCSTSPSPASTSTCASDCAKRCATSSSG